MSGALARTAFRTGVVDGVEPGIDRLAGAIVMRRGATAVVRGGGGPVAVSGGGEIAPPGLQGLVYDLDAGLPFLFAARLVLQLAAAASSAPGAECDAERMRAALTASGQWREAA